MEDIDFFSLQRPELGIPFNEVLARFEANSYAAFRKFSPTGQVPTLHDGDTVIWESLGITESLAERHDGIWPAEADARVLAPSIQPETEYTATSAGTPLQKP